MSTHFHQPTKLEEAIVLADRLAEGARILAGGTDLAVQMRRGRIAPHHLIDITRVAGLAGIRRENGRVELGACTRHAALEDDAMIRRDLPMIAEAAREVGGRQVRNAGTVGGNVVNASPAADVVVPLLAFDAEVMLAGPQGSRRASLATFLLGPGRTGRRHAEILTGLTFAVPVGGNAFLKAGRRKAMEIALVSVAASLAVRNGACADVRIALGAVGPVPRRTLAAEGRLDGLPPSAEAFRVAGEIAAQDCSPISDVRASADFRRHLVSVLVARALAVAAERCRAAS